MNTGSLSIPYKDYIIEIVNDPHYALRSTDNAHYYKTEYFKGIANEDRYYPSSKHGIRIFKSDTEINSCILCETGGGTGIHDRSVIVKEGYLYICCGDKIYSLDLPDLTIVWMKRIDPATCFAIYEIENEFIIHGELEISRIDQEGNILWNFGARDIFVCPDGSPSFILKNDTILLQDFEGYCYLLDLNGNQLSSNEKKVIHRESFFSTTCAKR